MLESIDSGRDARPGSQRRRTAASAIGVLWMLSLAAPVAAAVKGPTWSEVTGERFSHSSMNRSATIIKSVDGHPALDRRPWMPPGHHVILVQWVPKKGLRNSDRTLRLELKACKRYYINAQFSSPSSALWQPVVDKVEDIAGCRMPAGGSDAPAGANMPLGSGIPEKAAR